jgi:hypothetical protein
MDRGRLLHFLDIDTREPLCGGGHPRPASASVNGVSLCDVCARRVTDHLGRAMGQQASLAAAAWPPGGSGA